MRKGGMIETNKYKIMFLLFILFWSSMLIGAVRQFTVISIGEDNIQDYMKLIKNQDNNSCILAPPDNATIILRFDDVQAYAWNSISKRIINDTLNRNMSIVLAVIPKNIEMDQYIDQFINEKIKENPSKIEIAQHGANHLEFEYANLSADEAYNLTKIGLNHIVKTFKVYPVTFVPPNDIYNDSVPKALKRLNFKIISAKQDEYRNSDSITYIGFTVVTNDMSGGTGLVPIKDLMMDCRNSLDKKNICVINIHPQDYALIDGSLDYKEYNHYLELLDVIKGIRTATFRDMIRCSKN